MKALGYNPHVTIQIALAGNAADLIKHHDRAAQRGEQLPRFLPASGCETMLFPRLLTQHTSEAMHVQGNDGQSNRSGKSLSTFRPNTVEATVFEIVDG